MGAIPPRIPGQEELFSWMALGFVILFLAVATLPAVGIARMLVEIIYPGRW